jgi:hypothetical protein
MDELDDLDVTLFTDDELLDAYTDSHQTGPA